jgi:hypothetical protein
VSTNSTTATRPVPSDHVEAKVRRMAGEAVMHRISWATDAPFSSRYFPLDVPSEDGTQTYRVIYDADTDTATCTCEAGTWGTPTCAHRELGRHFLGLRRIN